MRLLKTSPNQTAKQDEDVFSLPQSSYQQYYTRPRTASGAIPPPRRSCSLVRRGSGARPSIEGLTNTNRSLDAESLLMTSSASDQAGNTMSLQRRGANRMPLSPQHYGPRTGLPPVDVQGRSRARTLSHSVGPATGALMRGVANASKPVG